MNKHVSDVPTPYAVHCREHGLVYMTEECYMAQMMAADSLWKCPICFREADWDDENYETALGLGEEE